MTDDPEDALFGAVQADPFDVQAREIYADWLEQRGDPRGEYLRLETQRTRLPERLAELAQRIDPGWIAAIRGHHRISIVGCGPGRIAAIKALRELTGLGLQETVDLVDRASEQTPALLYEAVELARAREISAQLEPLLKMRIEPSSPPAAISPGGPSSPPAAAPYHRPYRVWLVGITQRLLAIQALHERYERGYDEARALVDGVVAGRPFELAGHADATTAAEVAASCGRFGAIRIEHA